LFHRIDDGLAGGIADLSEDGVLSVQPVGGDVGDEELGTVGVGACVGHGEAADFVLRFAWADFIGEFIACVAGAGALGASALDHEIGDDAMKFQSVIEAIAGEKDEVIHGLGRVLGEKIDGDLAARGIKNGGVFFGGVDRHRRRSVIAVGHWIILLESSKVTWLLFLRR
jgi:hypothetical protein